MSQLAAREAAVSLAVKDWVALGIASFTISLDQWARVPRLSLLDLFPSLSASRVTDLFLAHLMAYGQSRTRMYRWDKDKSKPLLCLLDPSFLPHLSWHAIFSSGKGFARKQQHLDEIFQGVIQMPWHTKGNVAAEEPVAHLPAAVEDPEFDLSVQWATSLATMGLVPFPQYEDIMEQLQAHCNLHANKCAVFSIFYARTSSEGKASDKSSSFLRQKLAFSSGYEVPKFDGVHAVPLCISYNPTGEPSFLPMASPHRPYAAKLWQLMHDPSPLIRLVEHCFQPCLASKLCDPQ